MPSKAESTQPSLVTQKTWPATKVEQTPTPPYQPPIRSQPVVKKPVEVGKPKKVFGPEDYTKGKPCWYVGKEQKWDDGDYLLYGNVGEIMVKFPHNETGMCVEFAILTDTPP